MTIEQILAVFGLIGIGSIIPALISFFFGLRKTKHDSKQELKEKRYKAILLLCYTFINYEKESMKLKIQRPDINSKEELLNELTTEWVNMSLYASDGVILKMKNLLENQTKKAHEFVSQALIVTVIAGLSGV